MTPDVSEPTKPSGWPTANASSPTWPPPPRTAGTIGLAAGRSGTSTAMSFSGSAATISAARPRAVDEARRIVVAPSTTWSAVRIAPLALTITPVPRPGAVPPRRRAPRARSGRGTGGSAGRRAPRWRVPCRSSIADSTASEAIAPTSARSSGGLDGSRVATPTKPTATAVAPAAAIAVRARRLTRRIRTATRRSPAPLRC